MKRVQEVSVAPDTTLYQAVERLDASALQILLVVDKDGRLMGTITDGDIRRSILLDRDMDAKVAETMNRSPIVVNVGTDRATVLSMMQTHVIHAIPVVDAKMRVVGLETDTRLLREGIEDTWVVLMAGGLGMRLRPLTDAVPKPMLPVQGKPILEGIVERFLEQGFHKFFISINYKAEMIREYFGDGSKWDCEISYLHEGKRLGTAGALSLLPKENRSKNILVMNGDLITTIDFRQFLDFHQVTSSCASMCVRDHSIQIPYGVVEVDGDRFRSVIEKPAHQYYINAGIYALASNTLQYIPENNFIDITSLFEKLRKKEARVSVFPIIWESWLDIGRIEEYEKANNEYSRHSYV